MKSSALTKSLRRTEVLSAARADLWRMGDLSCHLDSNQLALRHAILTTKRKRFVLECARRIGKSFLLVVLAFETCLSKRRARVVYAASTYKDLVEFILPVVEMLSDSAPADCKPRFDALRWRVVFPNGSYISMFGCDNKQKANRGRGPAADLVIVDEAGFNPVLGYALRSVLKPQTLTTGAMTILASTPAEEAGHEFTHICELAEAHGDDAWVHRTIYDNPRLTQEEIADYIRQDAEDEGMTVEEYKESDTFKREYLALRINDRRLTAVPAWAESESRFFVPLERPRFFDAYSGFDPGGVDPHAGVLGFFDYKANRLVIEDELFLREGQDTGQIADELKRKETALWGASSHDGTLRGLREAGELPPWLHIAAAKQERIQPFLRVCDTDTQFINDMLKLHGVAFVPAEKTDKALHINELNVLIRQGRLWIHPRCRNLDRQLKTTVWKNHKRTEFQRKNGEHGDLVDALSYLARRVAWSVNPFPPNWDIDPAKNFVPHVEDEEGAGWRDAFRV